MLSGKSILLNLVIAVIITAVYIFKSESSNITQDDSLLIGIILKALAYTYFLNIFASIICLLIDNDREQSPSDDFSGSNLFYRYGVELQSSTITIGLDKLQVGKTPMDVANSLNNCLFTEISSQFATRPKDRFNISFKEITDRNLVKDKRRFIKSLITTQRGSQVTHFILILMVGKQLIVHEYYFLKGKTKFVFSILFFAFSPFHFWAWFQLWIFRNFSLINHLKQSYNNSSFELIDLETITRAMKFLTSTSIKHFVIKEGLLTDELSLVINQNISNSQNINISNSNNIGISNIKSSIQ